MVCVVTCGSRSSGGCSVGCHAWPKFVKACIVCTLHPRHDSPSAHDQHCCCGTTMQAGGFGAQGGIAQQLQAQQQQQQQQQAAANAAGQGGDVGGADAPAFAADEFPALGGSGGAPGRPRSRTGDGSNQAGLGVNESYANLALRKAAVAAAAAAGHHPQQAGQVGDV